MDETADVEYTMQFHDILNKSPLFRLGYDPKRIYYERNPIVGKTTVPASYFPPSTNIEDFKQEEKLYAKSASKIGQQRYADIVKAIENKEIPEKDFVFMSNTLFPGDTTISYVDKKLDKADELSYHMHEFLHRALHTVPELNQWRKNNSIGQKEEEILIGGLIIKQFPQLKKIERNRIKKVYGRNLENYYTERVMKKRIKEIEEISNNVLKSQGRQFKQETKPSLIPIQSVIKTVKKLFQSESSPIISGDELPVGKSNG